MKDKENKKGYVSLEFLFGLSTLLLTVLLVIGMFCYIYPRQKIEKEVAMLAQYTKVNGGLTQANISDFKSRMNKMGFSPTINVYTKSQSAINVAPRGTPYAQCMSNFTPFVTRSSGDTIYIDVVVNAADGLAKGPIKYFGAKMLPENYRLVDTVLSERNKC